MKFINPAKTTGFALWLGLGIAVLLIGLGLRPDALPFIPGASYSDAVISHWPNALFLQRSIQSGYFPLWRNLLMSGQPFAANPLNKVWYPPQWLVIFLPVTLHLNLMIWAHLVLGGVGMRTLGQRLGMSLVPASIAGVAYTLMPRLFSALGAGHLDIVYAIGWFPWVLWAAHYAVTSSDRIEKRIAIIGFIGALCFLADIRISAFIAAVALGMVVWFNKITPLSPNPFPPRKRGEREDQVQHAAPMPGGSAEARPYKSFVTGKIFVISAGGVLALGLTAVQWLPLITLAPYLSRSGLSIEDASVYSLAPLQLVGMIIPRLATSNETMIYTGISVLMLAVIGLVAVSRFHRERLFWVVVAIVAALYALGSNGPLWPLLVKVVPALLWLRVPARAWIVVNLAIIILAGFGLEQLLLVSPQRYRYIFMAVLAMLIVFDLLWTDVTLVEWRSQNSWLDAYTPVAQALIEDHATRIYSPSYSLPQQAAAYWNIPDFGGVDPFQIKSYLPPFESASGVRADGYSITLPANLGADPAANQDATIDSQQLAAWNVSHVVSAFAIQNPGLRYVSKTGDAYIYENTDLDRNVIVTWQGPNCFTAINQSVKAVNILPWLSGWERTNAADNAVSVQPSQTINQCYNPPDLVPSVGISVLSLLIGIGLLVRARNG